MQFREREAEGLLQYSLPKAHKTRCKGSAFFAYVQAREGECAGGYEEKRTLS